jgi:hypothetical protein
MPIEDFNNKRHDAAMEQWLHDHAEPIRDELDVLRPVASTRDLVSQAQAALVRAVRDARDRGASWSQIGATLGVSKQTAWDRYGKDDKP